MFMFSRALGHIAVLWCVMRSQRFLLCCCSAVQALGLDEGHAVCQALHDVKLAVNSGSYSQLESASGAVAVCVLADWFEGFTDVSRVQAQEQAGMVRGRTCEACGLVFCLPCLVALWYNFCPNTPFVNCSFFGSFDNPLTRGLESHGAHSKSGWIAIKSLTLCHSHSIKIIKSRLFTFVCWQTGLRASQM
jgi:hypothetical protein